MRVPVPLYAVPFFGVACLAAFVYKKDPSSEPSSQTSDKVETTANEAFSANTSGYEKNVPTPYESSLPLDERVTQSSFSKPGKETSSLLDSASLQFMVAGGCVGVIAIVCEVLDGKSGTDFFGKDLTNCLFRIAGCALAGGWVNAVRK